MKFKYLFIFFLIANVSNAQPAFIVSGKINFERKIAQHTLSESLQNEENMEGGWLEEAKKVYPKIVTDNYVMDFNQSQSYYRIAKENPDNKYMIFGSKPSETDFTFQNLNDQLTVIKKTLFENEYFIKDSLTKYEWKITGEIRDIAGFECKKAVTKICDSVVVVAFYTDQIMVKAGPESFNGLPGMILGLAIPRLFETIYATKIELSSSVITTPVQGKSKAVKRSQISADLKKGLEQWGKDGKVIVWSANL